MPEGTSNHAEDWALFEAHERPNRVANYRICCLVAAFFMPAGMVLDLIDFGMAEMYRFLPVRFASSGALLVCWALLRLPMGVAAVEIMGLVVAIPPIAAIAWMIKETGGAESPYYAGLNLVTLGAGLLMRWRTRDSAIVSVVTMMAFILASMAAGPLENWRAVGNNLYFLAVNGFIVVVGTWVYVGIRFREFQTNQQLAKSKEDLKAANDRLGAQNNQLKELDKMKSNFFANISHELRTPLTLLHAPIQQMLTRDEEIGSDQRKQHLHRMQANTSRLLGLINDLLDLAKMEAGRLELRRGPVNVSRFVADLELSLRGAAEAKGLELKTSVAPEITGAEFDREKMERVCINLLSNALKFTPEGGLIEFTVSVSGGNLHFRVRDTGQGLAPNHLPHVFDRFWQADESSSRQYQGTGIGLALVKEFTEAHGGQVTAESVPGEGAVFTAIIPYLPGVAKTGTEIVDDRNRLGGEGTWSPFLKSARDYQRASGVPLLSGATDASRTPGAEGEALPVILIAEDEPDIMDLLVEELRGSFELRTFGDGGAAVQAALADPPDVVLTDMMMPVKDGLQLCRELRAAEGTLSVPIVMLTARVDEETKMACLEAGATDFLTKPFSPTELLSRLRNLGELSGKRKALQVEKTRLEQTLTQLQETEALLMRNEKLAALGRMSAGLIHEINNPLNYAKQALLILQSHSAEIEGPDGDECREMVGDVLEGVERVVTIVSDLRGFSRPGTTFDEMVMLKEIVGTTLRFFSHAWPDDLERVCEVDERAVIMGSSGMLVQVLVNLIQNSLDALAEKTFPEGETPQIIIRGGFRGTDKVFLTLRDNGPGISEEKCSSIFDPFFTTKDVGKGLGLGLSICHRIISDHKGTINVSSEMGKYCEFTLEFPIVGAEVSI